MRRILLVIVSFWVTTGSRAQMTNPVQKVVTCEIRLIEAPRAEINRLLPKTAYVLNAELLQQLDKMVAEKKATILAQPRISTATEQVAMVKSVREYIYPSVYGDFSGGFNLPTPDVVASNLTSRYPFPLGFNTSQLGVFMNVTPTISADGKSISVALAPEISFTGKLPYVKHEVGSPYGKVEVKTPDFYSWSMATTAVLKNGSTVLVTILDPVRDEQYIAQENVVLVLLTAAIQPGE